MSPASTYVSKRSLYFIIQLVLRARVRGEQPREVLQGGGRGLPPGDEQDQTLAHDLGARKAWEKVDIIYTFFVVILFCFVLKILILVLWAHTYV